MVFLFCMPVKAADQADVQKMQQLFSQKFNVNLTNNNAAQIIDKWQQSNVTYCVCSQGVVRLCTSVTVEGSNIRMVYVNSSTNFSPTVDRTLTWSNDSASSNVSSDYWLNFGSWQDFHVVSIDWDNPYYSIAIHTPEYEVTYRKVGLNVDVPLNFNLNAPVEGEYYCEVMAEFTLPVYLTYNAVQNYFEASRFTYVTKEIVNPDQFVEATDLTANTLHTVLTNMWQAALNEVPLSSVSIKFPSDFTAQEILDGREVYDELRKSCGLAGTSIKFYIRYFVIEDETKFVVGPWRIWNSVSPKTFNDELPSYYLPYAIASGNTGTSTSTSSDPDEVYIPVGGDNPTGEYYSPTFNITVGSNVPNYPDYPTISSYNMDNLLVSTMNNAKGISSFFGEFGTFLTDSFTFIPGWIWAIIGFGFSLSIVVMFLKIL